MRACISDFKDPFVQVVAAFLEHVLHIDTTSILDISSESTFPVYPPMRKYFLPEYAVTVRLSPPAKHLGDTVYLGLVFHAGGYSISEMAFKPGWKPAQEQAE